MSDDDRPGVRATIHGSSLRIQKLDDDGNPVGEPSTITGAVLGFEPGSKIEIDDLTPSTLKSIAVELDIDKIDPKAMDILLGKEDVEDRESHVTEEGDVLVWSDAEGKWVQQAPAAELDDVLLHGVFDEQVLACLVIELMDEDDLQPVEMTDDDHWKIVGGWHYGVKRVGRVALVKLLGTSSSNKMLIPLYQTVPTKEVTNNEGARTRALKEHSGVTANKISQAVYGIDINKDRWQEIASTVNPHKMTQRDKHGNAVWDGPRWQVKWVRAFVSTGEFNAIGRENEAESYEIWKLDAREIIANRWQDPDGEAGTFGPIEPNLLWVLPMACYSETFYHAASIYELRWDAVPAWAKELGMAESNFNRSGFSARDEIARPNYVPPKPKSTLATVLPPPPPPK